MLRNPKGDFPCSCWLLDNAIDDPAALIVFDAGQGCYRLRHGRHEPSHHLSYCPFCGGRVPTGDAERRRRSVAARVGREDWNRVKRLIAEICSPDDAAYFEEFLSTLIDVLLHRDEAGGDEPPAAEPPAAEEDASELIHCDFCGKSRHLVRKLIAGPQVHICDECIERLADIYLWPTSTPGPKAPEPKGGRKDPADTLYCSFCGKADYEIKQLATHGDSHICDECIELCAQIVHEETKQATPPDIR